MGATESVAISRFPLFGTNQLDADRNRSFKLWGTSAARNLFLELLKELLHVEVSMRCCENRKVLNSYKQFQSIVRKWISLSSDS